MEETTMLTPIEREIPSSFSIGYSEQLEEISPLITKARVRVFYKYENRNGGYITDEFAAKLEKSLAWVPVVGIYDYNAKDFTSHQANRNLAPMFGLVPPDHHGAYEDHMDEDGVTRSYWTVDVYLYTGRYELARQIIGNPQSLEFERSSITGTWRHINSGDYYFYDNADFVGLMVLGKEVEPAFEGAAFYQLLEQFGLEKDSSPQVLLDAIVNYVRQDLNINTIGGTQTMDDKAQVVVEEEVKTETTPVAEAELETPAAPVTDEEAAPAAEEAKEEEKKEEEEEEEDKKDKKEDSALEPTVEEKLISAEAKIVELTESITTYQLEVANTKEAFEKLQADFDLLKGEKDAQILAEKEAILESYAGKVSDDFAETLKAKVNDYSVEDLEKELLFAWKKAQPSDFSKEAPAAVPAAFAKEETDGITAILDKHKNS